MKHTDKQKKKTVKLKKKSVKIKRVTADRHTSAGEQSPAESVPASQAHKGDLRIPRFVRKMRPRRREKICRILGGSDIKYRGPLSYRTLRILAWAICAFATGGTILKIAYRFFSSRLLPVVNDVGQILSSLSNYALPMFMLASFAVILNRKKGYRQLFIAYAASALLIYIGYFVIVEHYMVGIFEYLLRDRAAARTEVNNLITVISPYGYFANNIFIDLLLCTALTFFLTYRPKRVFTGKLHIVFRLFSLLPIAYELGCVALKILAGMGRITLPVFLWPLLTTKPPVIFMIFLAITVFIKNRERSFRASGFTHQEFLQYQKTKRNSWQFSVYVCLVFIIFSILDVLMMVVLPLIFAFTVSDFQDMAQMERLVDVIMHIGVGKGIYLFLLAPFTLLFSYTRTHKNNIVDLFVPIGGVIFVVLFTIEMIFEMLRLMPSL